MHKAGVTVTWQSHDMQKIYIYAPEHAEKSGDIQIIKSNYELLNKLNKYKNIIIQ